jgi:sugar lactone lactonase YvrE
MGGSIQGKVVSPAAVVTTLAGVIPGASDGTGPSARFNRPCGITTDGNNLYVADYGNHTIRKIVISTGDVTTLAGTAGTIGSAEGAGGAASFSHPSNITTDGTNLYVADTDNHTIRKIVIPTGVVSTLAGKAGTLGFSDGVGAAAAFRYPSGVVSDGTNLYVADAYNYTIRKIVISTGEVTTFAGTPGRYGSNDGTGATAEFSRPSGIATDGRYLYVADSDNNTIRKIDISTRDVTTLAGTAGQFDSTDETGPAARFGFPTSVTLEGNNLYVADTLNNTIRKVVISSGLVSTLAGLAPRSGSSDGIGVAASFNLPCGITTDGTNLYIADTDNHTIRKIVISTREVTTLAGMAGAAGTGGSADGIGKAASFHAPKGITTDGPNLYIVDSLNHTIRKIAISTGEVTTLAGTAGAIGFADGVGPAASFHTPFGITTDGTNLYLTDGDNHTIRKIVISTRTVSTLAGTGQRGSIDAIGTGASFYSPRAITTDGTNLYIADTHNHTIRKIVISTGEVTTLAGAAGRMGSNDGIGVAASFNLPDGITTDGTNLYVADSYNNTIREIVISTGEVTTLAGAAGRMGSNDGIGVAALFQYPCGITSDGTNLYVVDSYNHTIRRIVLSTGAVSTLAGTPGKGGSTDGTGIAASFTFPNGITTDGFNFYVTDRGNNTIRKIQ